jgi:hypothetical protein
LDGDLSDHAGLEVAADKAGKLEFASLGELLCGARLHSQTWRGAFLASAQALAQPEL